MLVGRFLVCSDSSPSLSRSGRRLPPARFISMTNVESDLPSPSPGHEVVCVENLLSYLLKVSADRGRLCPSSLNVSVTQSLSSPLY